VFDLYVSVACPTPVTLNLHFHVRSYKYGPCIGTTRMQRWKRAQALGLNPPIEVRASFSLFVFALGALDGWFRYSRSSPRRKDTSNKNISRTCSVANSNLRFPISQFFLAPICVVRFVSRQRELLYK